LSTPPTPPRCLAFPHWKGFFPLPPPLLVVGGKAAVLANSFLTGYEKVDRDNFRPNLVETLKKSPRSSEGGSSLGSFVRRGLRRFLVWQIEKLQVPTFYSLDYSGDPFLRITFLLMLLWGSPACGRRFPLSLFLCFSA